MIQAYEPPATPAAFIFAGTKFYSLAEFPERLAADAIT
jgi:hypothetical protein